MTPFVGGACLAALVPLLLTPSPCLAEPQLSADLLKSMAGLPRADCRAICTSVDGYSLDQNQAQMADTTTITCTCAVVGPVRVACRGHELFEECQQVPLNDVQEDCATERTGFTCPANAGCAAGEGQCNSDPQWQEWIIAHNVYRCMHNVPSLSWSMPMHTRARDEFQKATTVDHPHVDNFQLSPPYGPSALNLYHGAGAPLNAVQSWYEESKNCVMWPGCSNQSGVADDFKTLVWHGVKEIGCFRSDGGVSACLYRGPDFASDCRTPQIGKASQQVFAKLFSFETCVWMLRTVCRLPVPDDLDSDHKLAIADVTGLKFEHFAPLMLSRYSLLVGALALSAGAALGLATVLLVRGQRPKEPTEGEGALLTDE